MTKEIDALMILPNENFNYSCYSDSYIMDSWNYIDSIESSKVKPRLAPEDNLTGISIVPDACKTLKEQKSSCSLGGTFKQMDRTSNASSPELITLQNTPIMKLLSGNIFATQSQVARQMSPSSNSYVHTVAGDSFDKQVISNIFDSLINTSQKLWPSENTYSTETTSQNPFLPNTDIVGHTSPSTYSDSYTNSPPESYSRNDFQFILGASQASQNKTTELPMVYLNKGQFYPITLQGVDSSAGIPCSKVKTVIMAVFENEKSPEMQLKCWNHWHARQPTAKQRVIDIADYKEVFTGISNVDEVAFNALSFIWNTNEEAKVYVGINSLSTDFSSQKGVKGVPLNLQIDTYDFSSGSNQLIHRAACQIKIFCDKGAERKMRDEERKRVKRRVKNVADTTSGSGKQTLVSSSIGKECTFFKTLDDHVTQPVLFIPETHYSTMQRLVPSTTAEEIDKSSLKRVGCFSDSGEQCSSPASKQLRREELQRVLLYVRQETEEVFDALMLNSPTLRGLRQAISEKYGLQEDTIGKIFKKCKRGIFVNMDDNIIEHYSNHSAFLIEISEMMVNQFQITLLEL